MVRESDKACGWPGNRRVCGTPRAGSCWRPLLLPAKHAILVSMMSKIERLDGGTGRRPAGQRRQQCRPLPTAGPLQPQRPTASAAGSSGTATSGYLDRNSGVYQSHLQQQEQQQQQQPVIRRRAALAAAVAVAASAASGGPWAAPATASLLPEAVDKAWEGLGGGPADLVFPGVCLHACLCVCGCEELGMHACACLRCPALPRARCPSPKPIQHCQFACSSHEHTIMPCPAPPRPALPADNFLGVWQVESVLTSVELPLGPEFVPDMRVGRWLDACAVVVLLIRWLAMCVRCWGSKQTRSAWPAPPATRHPPPRICSRLLSSGPAGGAAGSGGGLERCGALSSRIPAGACGRPRQTSLCSSGPPSSGGLAMAGRPNWYWW